MNELLLQIIDALKKIPSDFKVILERKIQLFVLDLGDSFSKSVAEAIPKIIGGILLLIGLLFLLLALGFWLGELFESNAIGFVIVAVVFLLSGIIGITKTVDSTKSSTKKKIEQNFIELSDKIGSQNSVKESSTKTTNVLPK